MNKRILFLHLLYLGFCIMSGIYFYFFLDYGSEMWSPEIMPGMLLLVGSLIFFSMAGVTGRALTRAYEKEKDEHEI